MSLRLRFVVYLVCALFRSRIDVLESSSIWLRVLPNDVDIRRLADDRYLAYMDLGRNDLLIRLGLARKLAAAIPFVRLLSIRFRHPAKLMQRLELRTRIVCWTEAAVWIEQQFFLKNRSIALAYCEMDLRTATGGPTTSQLLAGLGRAGLTSPETPPLVRALEEQGKVMQQLERDTFPSSGPDHGENG
jgi:acyl-CoA thioesterase FadM